MKLKFKIAVFLVIVLISGCVIKYKSKHIDLTSFTKKSSPTNVITISKRNDSLILYANQQIKNQLTKKGYKSFIVTIDNNTKDTLTITSKTFYAIRNFEPTPYLTQNEIIQMIKFNKGLFFSAVGFGILSPFGYAGRKLIFSSRQLVIAIPLLVYGTLNTIITLKSKKQLNEDLKRHYLINKIVPPFASVSGVILVKTADDEIDFIYRSKP